MSIKSFSPADFSGQTRLFPLPDLVMFPYALQALHVFEPRYIALVRDALAADRLLALGLLQPGWDADTQGRPAIHPTVCLCQIVTHQERPDGRYDIVVFGVSRARIAGELEPKRSYREVQVELMPDRLAAASAERAQLEHELFEAVEKLLPGNASMIHQLHDKSEPHMALSVLTDVLAYSLPFNIKRKQALLEQTCVLQRAHQIIDTLTACAERAAHSQDFPPRFSAN